MIYPIPKTPNFICYTCLKKGFYVPINCDRCSFSLDLPPSGTMWGKKEYTQTKDSKRLNLTQQAQDTIWANTISTYNPWFESFLKVVLWIRALYVRLILERIIWPAIWLFDLILSVFLFSSRCWFGVLLMLPCDKQPSPILAHLLLKDSAKLLSKSSHATPKKS